MPRDIDLRFRSGSTTPSAASFNVGEPAWDSSAGKLFIKNAAGTMVEIGAGGGGTTAIYEYATTASFPATGAAATLYIATDYSRVYRYDSTAKYIEVGSLGGDGSLWSNLVPGTPSGVTGTGGDGQVSLSWTAPTYTAAALTDYSIQYSSNSGSTWTAFSKSASTATSATVTGLTNGTAYTFRVAAVSALGTGSFSTASASIKPGGDPYFSSVSLLLTFDGANNSTTFTDKSNNALTVTTGGSPVISTTQSKFGGSSLYLNGSSYLNIASNAVLNMGTGDFTAEFWAYHTDQTSAYPAYLSSVSGWNSGAYGLRFDNTGQAQKWSFHHNPLGDPLIASSSTYTFNAWRHIAFVRQSGTLRIYVGGVQAASTSTGSSTALDLGYGGLRIGMSPWDGTYVTDYIDSLRITKVCRYPDGTTFTPSTTAWPEY